MIVLGDFNHVSLKKALPRYKPQIHIATRMDKTLDQCYFPIPEAYHAVARAPLGKSDHNTILLVPKYHQKLKAAKPTVKHFRIWSPQAIHTLQDCLDSTEWGNFWTGGQDDINTFTDTVTSYIQFCESVCIPIRTVSVFNNSKPWFNNEVRVLCRKKHVAFKCGDMDKYKLLKYEFWRAVFKAKASYKAKLENRLQRMTLKVFGEGCRTLRTIRSSTTLQIMTPPFLGGLMISTVVSMVEIISPPLFTESRVTLHLLSLNMMLGSCSASKTSGRRQGLAAWRQPH